MDEEQIAEKVESREPHPIIGKPIIGKHAYTVNTKKWNQYFVLADSIGGAMKVIMDEYPDDSIRGVTDMGEITHVV